MLFSWHDMMKITKICTNRLCQNYLLWDCSAKVPRILFQMKICMSYIVLIKETNIQSHCGVAVAQLGVMIEIGCAKELGTCRVFFKYCVFSSKCCDFLTLPVLLHRWFSICLLCVHTLTQRENRERPESGIFLTNLKNTILNEHPVPASIH